MAKKSLKKGIFITFEGPEGSGKSTHSKLAARFLREIGYDVVYTRDPGGTKVGDKIRDVLLHSRTVEMSALCEMLLFEASRVELIRQVIKPALRKKKVVISDRFNDATLVYQGYAGKIPLKDIKKVESLSLEGVRPELTIVLDIKVKDGLKKIRKFLRDRMESKELRFHRRVRRGYLERARHDRRRIKVIRTKKTIDSTFAEVKRKVMNAVRRYKRA